MLTLALLTQLTIPCKPIFVTLPDGTSKPVQKIGQASLISSLALHNVLHISNFKFNLLSVSKIVTQNHLCVIFYPDICVFQDLTTERIMAMAPKQGGLYRLDPIANNRSKTTKSVSSYTHPIAVYDSQNVFAPTIANKVACVSTSLDVMHARLGHTSVSKMKHITECKSHSLDSFFYEICVLAKSHRLPFHKSSITTQISFQLVHMDLWGPYRTANLTGEHFFLTLVDDFNRSTWTHLGLSKVDPTRLPTRTGPKLSGFG